MGRLKKYVLEAPSLAPRERFGLFQQVEQMVFLPEKNQPDIHLDSFTFYAYPEQIPSVKVFLPVGVVLRTV